MTLVSFCFNSVVTEDMYNVLLFFSLSSNNARHLLSTDIRKSTNWQTKKHFLRFKDCQKSINIYSLPKCITINNVGVTGLRNKSKKVMY